MTYLGFGPEIPETFSSLEEARNSLDYQTNRFFQIEQFESERNAEEGRKYYQHVLAEWNKALERYLQYATLDSKSQQAAIVLNLSYRIGRLRLRYPISRLIRDESLWDDCTDEGDEIVALAEQVIALGDIDAVQNRPTFSFERGIVGPLYGIAHKCRDPFVRRRAISALRSAPRQEGIWDSRTAALVAEQIMNIEEDGLGKVRSASDVPDWVRISDVEASFDPVRRKATFIYSRRRIEWEDVRGTVVKIVEW